MKKSRQELAEERTELATTRTKLAVVRTIFAFGGLGLAIFAYKAGQNQKWDPRAPFREK